jgi:hypothetical protein
VSTTPVAAGLAEAALQDCLAHFPQVQLRVSGTCMAPALAEGATVCLEPAATRPPRWGDVVLVRQPAGLRLHRLVWRPSWGLGWRTQADQSPSCDPRVASVDVLATAVTVAGLPGSPRSRVQATRSLVRAIFSRLRAFLPR